jgi:hypothetical protein
MAITIRNSILKDVY